MGAVKPITVTFPTSRDNWTAEGLSKLQLAHQHIAKQIAADQEMCELIGLAAAHDAEDREVMMAAWFQVNIGLSYDEMSNLTPQELLAMARAKLESERRVTREIPAPAPVDTASVEAVITPEPPVVMPVVAAVPTDRDALCREWESRHPLRGAQAAFFKRHKIHKGTFGKWRRRTPDSPIDGSIPDHKIVKALKKEIAHPFSEPIGPL